MFMKKICNSLVLFFICFCVLFIVSACNLVENEKKPPSQIYKSFASDTISININGYLYTGPRYNRVFQIAVQDTLTKIHSNDLYDNQYFQLDADNSNSFYHKIGAFDKYIFGWADWYFKYAEPDYNGGIPHPNPSFVFCYPDPSHPDFNTPDNTWYYNIPLIGEPTQDPPNSTMRNEYLEIRD